MSYKPQTLSFRLLNTPIDYFSLRKNFFLTGFNLRIENIELDETERYIRRDKHLAGLDLDERETVVLNMQVGRGKTTICYQLIAEYFVNNYTIIICTPYIKLIKKYKQVLIDMFPKHRTVFPASSLNKNEIILNFRDGDKYVFHIDDYSAEDESGYYREAELAAIHKPIHLMTTNLFLGNSGDETTEQNRFKKFYLKKLLKATSKQKVVVFFDEIHESVHNFKSRLIPNLLKWGERVQKIYIASATFTPATIPVIKACSFLTGRNIRVYQSERIKNRVQANIQLHLLSKPFNSKDEVLHYRISKILKTYIDRNKPIHILAGTKALAAEVATRNFTSIITRNADQLNEYRNDTVNLLTNDTNVIYQADQNNIGTTFKTGIDIEDPEQLLLIILPTINYEPYYRNYGIFTNGITSITQALGRMRNGGEVHLIMHRPQELIGPKENYPSELHSAAKNHKCLFLNEFYQQLQKHYQLKLEKFKREVLLMEKELKIETEGETPNKSRFGFWYPNIHEFLLNNSDALAMKNEIVSYGRLLSPYVLWACINRQFANAELQHIYLYERAKKYALSDKTSFEVFRNILSSSAVKILTQGFRQSLKQLKDLLNFETNTVGEKIRISYSLRNDIAYSAAVLMNREINLTREAIRALYKIATGNDFDFNKTQYLLSCFEETKYIIQPTELTSLYTDFSGLHKTFNDWLSKQILTLDDKTFVPVKAYELIDGAFVGNVRKTFLQLKKVDEIIHYRTVSLFQHIDTHDDQTVRKSVFYEFLNLSFEINKSQKQVKGLKYLEVSPNAGLIPNSSFLV